MLHSEGRELPEKFSEIRVCEVDVRFIRRNKNRNEIKWRNIVRILIDFSDSNLLYSF
jgi:hypothetical protein